MKELMKLVRFDAPKSGPGKCPKCLRVRPWLIAQKCDVPVSEDEQEERKYGTLLLCPDCLKIIKSSIERAWREKRQAVRASVASGQDMHKKGNRRKFRQKRNRT